MANTLYTTVASGIEYYAGPNRNSEDERDFNAIAIAQVLSSFGWTPNCIAGILGNMQSESGCNPGAYYGYKDFSAVSFGLVQWDPTSKYQNWASDNGYLPYHDIEYQCRRIKYEFDNGIQYYARNYGTYKPYYLSASKFTQSTDDPYYLACVFAWNYERSAVVISGTETQRENLRQQRGGQARRMYELITGQPWEEGEEPPIDPDNPDIPDEPDDPDIPPEPILPKKSKILNLVLWNRRPQIRVVR